MEVEIIDLAQTIYDQGKTVTVRWLPGHRGVEGNELADQYARTAAESGIPNREGRQAARRTSLPCPQGRATEKATLRWREDIERRDQEKRTFRLPIPTARPGIRP